MLVTNMELDFFVGSKIGSLKHVKYNTEVKKNTKKGIENLQDLAELKKDDNITCLSWAGKEQSEILIGRKNGQVQVYNTISRQFTENILEDYDKGPVKGLCRVGNSLVTALESGVVKVWSEKYSNTLTIETGGNLDQMRQSPFEDDIVATGGKENDLKLWSLKEGKQIFQAKNVAHDWLQLRVPIWVSDICYLPESDGKVIAVCTRHGFIRLYDTRAQRRPVCTVEFKELPATCMTNSHMERHVVVGFGRGQMHQVDFREKGKPDKGYKGCVGAVTDLFTVPQGPYIVSVSLDRHLRVHNANTKKLLHKQYLTSKLTSLLVQTEGSTPILDEQAKTEQEEVHKEKESVSDDEYEAMFNQMEKIGPSKKKHEKRDSSSIVIVDTLDNITPAKKKKQVQRQTDVEPESEVTLDDSIKRLLKSTEKTKKKLEKEKKKKKAKSIFYDT